MCSECNIPALSGDEKPKYAAVTWGWGPSLGSGSGATYSVGGDLIDFSKSQLKATIQKYTDTAFKEMIELQKKQWNDFFKGDQWNTKKSA